MSFEDWNDQILPGIDLINLTNFSSSFCMAICISLWNFSFENGRTFSVLLINLEGETECFLFEFLV